MYVNKLIILEDYFGLPKDMSFELKDITLLVGDQGCGKSTLLHLLNDESSKIKIDLAPEVMKDGVHRFFLDTEMMNPRTVKNLDNTQMSLAFVLDSHLRSHGEVIRDLTVKAIDKFNKCVVLLDEPESGLSIKSQYSLVNSILKATKRKCQFIIATHCIPLIESQNDVYDVENKRWVNSLDYVSSFKV